MIHQSHFLWFYSLRILQIRPRRRIAIIGNTHTQWQIFNIIVNQTRLSQSCVNMARSMCKMARYIWNKERGTKRDRCKYVLLLSQTERDCPSAGNGNYIWQICARDWPPYIPPPFEEPTSTSEGLRTKNGHGGHGVQNPKPSPGRCPRQDGKMRGLHCN